MNVPLIDLKAEYRVIEQDVRRAFDEVLASQQFIMGPVVDAFEQEVAAWVAQHCSEPARPGSLAGVGVASGTDALLLALRALEIGPGDGVMTSPYTFFASASAIALVGATPIFSDVDPRTLTLDTGALSERLQEVRRHKPKLRVRAVIPVHLFGHCAEMGPILDLAQREGLEVVEDAAQAIGAVCRGAAAGTMGRMGCLSFFPTKNLGGFGDGGMVLTTDPAIAERLRRLRNHGMIDRSHHQELGVNSRLDALQAAVLRVKLSRLDGWTGARRAHARRYAELFPAAGLDTQLTLPVELPGHLMVYHHYVVRARRRDELMGFLREQGVGCEVYYPVPLHRQPCFEGLDLPLGSYPQAERAATEALALPVFPLMTAAQQDYVVEQIGRFYRTA